MTITIVFLLTVAGLIGMPQTIVSQEMKANQPVPQVEAQKWCSDVEYMVSRIELMHPNPYAWISKEEFYKLKSQLLGDISKMSEVDVVIAISELLAKLRDGHTRWALERSDPQWLAKNLHLLPVLSYPFKDGTYIMAGLPPYAEFVGMKVLQIGRVPISEVLIKLGTMFSNDNPYGAKKYHYHYLCIAEYLKKAGIVENEYEFEVLLQNDKGTETTAKIKPVSFMSMAGFLAGTWYPHSTKGLAVMNDKAKRPLPLWLKNQEKHFWYEYLPQEKVMFLQINSLNFPHGNSNEEGQFSSLCREFFNTFDQTHAEKLVIDIRRNTGGNHVELPLVKGILARPHIDKPNKLFLITGRVTFSAAVHLTSVLKRTTNITIIGEPASGRPNHYGANRSFKLPNHPYIEIRSSIDYYQDSEPFDFNIIHAPVIWAEMKASDYAANNDPALDAVMDYDRIQKLAGSFLLKLRSAYAEKGISGMKDEYRSSKTELLECGYNIERLLSELYGSTIVKNSKNKSELADYLSFAVSECPESIDLKYTLAYQLDSDGRFDEAKKMYKECLKMNPEHHYAKMRLGLIDMK